MGYTPIAQRKSGEAGTPKTAPGSYAFPESIPSARHTGNYISVADRATPEYKDSELHQAKYQQYKKEALIEQEKSRKANSFGGLFKATINPINLGKSAVKVAKDVIQGTARSGGMVGLTLIGKDELPESDASKFIFGERPLKSIPKAIQQTQKDLEGYGLNKKYSKILSPIAVVGSIGLDFTGAGAEKKGIEEAASAIAKSTDVAQILGHLKPFAKGTETDTKILAESLKDISDPQQVKNVLNTINENRLTGAKQALTEAEQKVGLKEGETATKTTPELATAEIPKVAEPKKVAVRTSEIKLPENPTPRQKELADTVATHESRLSELETERAIKQEVFDDSYKKFGSLGKYLNKKEGVLPGHVAVEGGNKSKFIKEMDSLAFREKYGVDSVSQLDDLQAGYDRFIEKRQELIDLSKKIREENQNMKLARTELTKDQRVQINELKDQVALGKIAEREDLAMAKKTRLEERKKAFDEGMKAMELEKEKMAKKAQNIKEAFQNEPSEPPGLFQKLKTSLKPLLSVDKKVQGAYTEWSRARNLAKEAGNKEFGKIGVPEKEGLKTIFDYQAGKQTPYSAKIKQLFDDLFKEANKRGNVDIKYRENYLPQVYKETAPEIHQKIVNYLTDNGLTRGEAQMYLEGKPLPDAVLKRLGLKPFFSKERVFPDYKTAMEYGLTPKYTNPDQLLAHYRESLEKAIADRTFIDKLVDEGKVLPVEDAPSSWKPVPLPFSTKGYYAEPAVAKFLEGVFDSAEKSGFLDTVIAGVANISKRAQELALSAGIPKTNINFFSIGQTIKQLTAGDYKAVPAFIRANFNGRSIKYFEENRDIIKKMAEEGIDLSGRIGNYKDVYDTLASKWRTMPKDIKNKETYQGFAELAGSAFDKLFNEKTFGSFMPQMYTQTFKDTYTKAIAKGLGEKEAQELAGNLTKNMFGMVDDVGRSKATQDKLSATFFAPKFREGIINTLFNTGKAGVDFVKHLGGAKGALDPALAGNRKLLAGMILSYGMYNALNYELNGHYMWDNPENKQFALQIPTKDGTLVYVEFMPSFLAFARNIAAGGIALAKGDISQAEQKFGSVFSMPVKITSEVIANSDYFGNPIYKETDTGATKALKIAKYIGLGVNHPYVKELVNQIEDKKPLYQSIVAATELPIKFGSKDKVSQNEFYRALDKKAKENARAAERVRETYEKAQTLIAEDKADEAQLLVDELSDEDYETYKKLRTADKRRLTIQNKAKIYNTVKEVEQLKTEGKEDEAQAIIDSLTDDEYKAYKLVKEQLF